MNGETVHALRGVSLRVDAGDYVAIVGPVGQRQVHPAAAAGRDRHPVGRHRGGARHPAGRACPTASSPGSASPRLGFIFQRFHLLPVLTARENVELPMAEAGVRAGRAPGARARAARVRRSGRPRRPPGHAALRRRDAARRDRPRAGQPARRAPRRRADRRARRGHRPGDPRALPPPQRATARRWSWSPTTSGWRAEAGRMIHHARRKDPRLMLLTLAFRHLWVRKLRSALPPARLRARRGVMVVLLSVGEAMLDQSPRRLAGGWRGGDGAPAGHRRRGDAHRRPGRDVLRHRACPLSHSPGARRAPAAAALVRTVAPAIEGKLLYLCKRPAAAVRAGRAPAARSRAGPRRSEPGSTSRQARWRDSPDRLGLRGAHAPAALRRARPVSPPHRARLAPGENGSTSTSSPGPTSGGTSPIWSGAS